MGSPHDQTSKGTAIWVSVDLVAGCAGCSDRLSVFAEYLVLYGVR